MAAKPSKLLCEIDPKDRPEFVKVTSSNVRSVGYDPKSETLYVEFGSGKYAYTGVPQAVFDALMAAPSKGAYLAENVKNQYEYVRLAQ